MGGKKHRFVISEEIRARRDADGKTRERRAPEVGCTERRGATGSLHESYAHERLKAYVCVLYDSLCAPLLLPWLGEVEGTSLAMYQAKTSPAPAHVPMFRVPTVLRRVPAAVPRTAVGADFQALHSKNG